MMKNRASRNLKIMSLFIGSVCYLNILFFIFLNNQDCTLFESVCSYFFFFFITPTSPLPSAIPSHTHEGTLCAHVCELFADDPQQLSESDCGGNAFTYLYYISIHIYITYLYTYIHTWEIFCFLGTCFWLKLSRSLSLL